MTKVGLYQVGKTELKHCVIINTLLPLALWSVPNHAKLSSKKFNRKWKIWQQKNKSNYVTCEYIA